MGQKMFRALSLILLSAFAVAAEAQGETGVLLGTVEKGVYTSPTGAFTIEIPVLPSLGGLIRDTKNVVTFHDSFGLQITVGAFAQDATLRWELSTRGTKDYLIYFFGNYVLPDFRGFCPETHIESAGYSADLLDGALFTYVLLPGGSMFTDRLALGEPAQPPVAKRGNVIFVRNGFTFVLSTELSERVTEGSLYKKTPDQENAILRNRLVGLISKMQFIKQEPAKQPATPAAP
jgi:hypothetical protein